VFYALNQKQNSIFKFLDGYNLIKDWYTHDHCIAVRRITAEERQNILSKQYKRV
jgi:hypothetical protein